MRWLPYDRPIDVGLLYDIRSQQAYSVSLPTAGNNLVRSGMYTVVCFSDVVCFNRWSKYVTSCILLESFSAFV